MRQQKIDEYHDRVMTPFVAAELGFVDDVIDFEDTRQEIFRSLEMTLRKQEGRPRKKHGNIPL
jgi:propionyl-CoA carboxylase beta chain